MRSMRNNGNGLLKKLAAGLTPRAGMAWPLEDVAQQPMSADELEKLWPDRRGGAPARKRRAVVVAPEIEAVDVTEVAMPRMVAHKGNLQDDASEQGACRELDSGIELADYLQLDDEDPWGRQSDDFDL